MRPTTLAASLCYLVQKRLPRTREIPVLYPRWGLYSLKTRALLCAAIAIASLNIGRADTITKYDRAMFANALNSGTASGQNFDGFTSGTTIGTVNGVTYSPSLGNAVATDAFLTSTPPNGLASTSAGYFLGNETITISFASAITAFGIDVNTYAPTAGDFQATLNDGATSASTFDVFPGTATGQFIGFTDSAGFTSVTIQALFDPDTGFQYTYTLDSLVYGGAQAIAANAVPEPASGALLLSALVACVFAAKRRLHSQD